MRKLGDVDQAFDARFEFDEGPEFHQPRDLAADDGVVRILAGGPGPGVLDHLAIGKADAAGFAVDLLDADADRLAFLHDLAGMLDAAPRQLADVQQPIDPVAQFDEGPEIHQLSHRAFIDLARSERLEEGLLLLFLLAFQHGPAAEDEVLPRGIGVGDQAGESLADELGQVFDPIQRNLAHGDEAAKVIDFALQPAACCGR